jgi:hypothetical protein
VNRYELTARAGYGVGMTRVEKRHKLIVERLSITAMFHDLGVTTEPPNNEVIARAVLEMYGANATAEEMDAVLDVVCDFGRLQRGERPMPISSP